MRKARTPRCLNDTKCKFSPRNPNCHSQEFERAGGKDPATRIDFSCRHIIAKQDTDSHDIKQKLRAACVRSKHNDVKWICGTR